MLTVGTLVDADILKTGKDVCILKKEVAVLWVALVCMPVKPQNATFWMQANSLQAIVVQSKGYAAIVINHWGPDNYSLMEIGQP